MVSPSGVRPIGNHPALPAAAGQAAAVRVCLIHLARYLSIETFIHAHADHLPGPVSVVHGDGARPQFLDGEPIAAAGPVERMRRATAQLARRFRHGGDGEWEWENTRSYLRAFRRCRPDVVLAEHGPTGVAVLDACDRLGLPLVVHFHGADASAGPTLQRYAAGYQELFRRSAAVVAVSEPMRQALLALGARDDRLHLNPYGVDCSQFHGGDPGAAGPVFLAVGRFVDKKAPHLTLLAFAEVRRRCPEAQLRMIGSGPLLPACRDLAGALGLADAVAFLEELPHVEIQGEMRKARAFVQHSVRAWNGDSEGTPVAIIEAGATGLPVIATRHAGIPDVVVHGQTGLLLDERDVPAMTAAMLRLATDAPLAAALGRAARERVAREFPMDRAIARLSGILESAALPRRTEPPRQASYRPAPAEK